MSLEDIREKKQGKGVYIIIGMLLVGMAGFGTSQFGTGGGSSPQVLLKTDNAEITVSEYENALLQLQKSNPDLDIAQARNIVISGLKERIALAEYISKYPFAASNKQIDEAIKSDFSFYDNGKFSEERFRQVVKVSPETYRRGLSKNIAMGDLQRIIARTSITSDAEIQPIIDMQNLSRDISVAKIPASAFSANTTATAEEVQKYYDGNADKFMTDEQFDIEFIDFNPKDITSVISVDNEQVLAELSPPREARYYLFKDEVSAQTAFDKVSAGEKVEALAKTMADAIDDSDDLGELTSTASDDSPIPQAAIDAIFALKNIGEVTSPITVDGAVYLFELTNKPEFVITDEKKADAKKRLQAKLAAPLVAEASEKLNKAVFESGTPTLQSIEEATGLASSKSGLMTLNSQKGILAFPEVVAAINASDKATGKIQDPVTIGDRVIIYKFADVKKSQQKPFADVKADAERLVVADKVKQQMSDAAEALIEKTKANGLSAAAGEFKYTTKSYKDFKGQVSDDDVLDQIAAILIAQESPKIGNDNASVIVSPLGDSYVYVTDTVSLEKNADTNADAEKQLIAQLNNRNGIIQLSAFLQSITERSNITDRTARLLQTQ
ncbi:MAG: SurA N-terminal domain-containing protein [Gammaproteobacteria bacterium]|nr:SurA N-terminal domain-containing protein [Gammaproteobacteria bacterium]